MDAEVGRAELLARCDRANETAGGMCRLNASRRVLNHEAFAWVKSEPLRGEDVPFWVGLAGANVSGGDKNSRYRQARCSQPSLNNCRLPGGDYRPGAAREARQELAGPAAGGKAMDVFDLVFGEALRLGLSIEVRRHLPHKLELCAAVRGRQDPCRIDPLRSGPLP
jgi:hypothetical protein